MGCLPLFLLLFLFSCKKESTDIGLDLIGDESLANAINVEYRNLSFRTVADDTFKVNSLSSSLLGIINDPVFGESKASLIVQPQLTETGINLNGNTIDSTQLNLVFDLYQTVDEGTRITNYELNYGDVESELVFDIYKLGEDLSDEIYFSNYTPSLGTKIGEYSGKFDLDSVKREIDGEVVTLSPRMTIKLDNTFGQEILDYDETTLSSNDNFIEIMKGLVLIPRSIVSGDGAIVAVEAINTRSSLDLFYSDSLQLAIPLGVSSKRVNFFETTHTPAIEEQKMGVGHFDITYVQSLGGTKVRIDVPQLESIIKLSDNIVINEAKLEISPDTSLNFTGKFEQAPRLWLLTPDTSNLNQSMTSFLDFNDVRFSESYYDVDLNSYTFYFNRYLQQLKQTYRLTGRNEFNWFYLSVPNDYPITPHRVIVDSDT
ncbi:MAG: DUF4270 family protein, partial [Bacteroidia bacterium]|nr:DUF4270 family protein [Bacteroidia bacterium]